MEKRGQVTIFIVIGFLVLIVIGIIFFIISSRNKFSELGITSSTLDEVRNQVNSDVKLCFQNIVENGLIDGARHGGDVILMNQLSTSQVGASGMSNPCIMMPTATQEMKVLYGPKIQYNNGVCTLYGPGDTEISNVDANTVIQFNSNMPDVNNLDNSLKNFIKNKIPGCIENFDKYTAKGWKLTSVTGNTIDDVSNFLYNNGNIKITLPNKDICPLDGKFIVSLSWPVKFSRNRGIGGEESFVLDDQEFIYNSNLPYFFDKSAKLLQELTSQLQFNPNQPFINLQNSLICHDCNTINDILDEFAKEVESCSGCHLIRATDPNSLSAYFFDIKCGEYYMNPNNLPLLPNTVQVKNKNIKLISVDNDKVSVEVDGESGQIQKDATISVAGIDITYDDYDQSTGKVKLIIGDSVNYLWGYYFGCNNNAKVCFIECPNTEPSTLHQC